MNKKLLLALPVLGLFAYFAMPKASAETRYLVTGASTIAPILQRVSERLQEREPDLVIDVETGGTGRGIKDSHAALNDLGMASRDLTPEEAEGLNVIPIALDGVALIAHASNPLEEITAEQVVAIYKGEITDWSALGGPAGDITVVNKAEGRSTLEVFLNHFGLKATEVKADVIIGDNAQGVRLVSGDEHALGYVSIGDAQRAAEGGVPIKLLRYRGVVPSVATVTDSTYPIRRTLYVLFRGEPDPIGQKILDYIASPEGTALVQELSFVPLTGSGS